MYLIFLNKFNNKVQFNKKINNKLFVRMKINKLWEKIKYKLIRKDEIRVIDNLNKKK